MLRKFIAYYRPHYKLFNLDIATTIVISGTTTILPYFIRQILDIYLPADNIRMIIWMLALALLMAVIAGIANYLNIRWGHVLGVRMEADMRQDMFCHLQKLSFSYFDKTKTGHIMSRLSNDLTSIAEAAHHAPEDLITSALTIIGAFIFMFMFNPLLAAIAIIPLPLIIVWGMLYQTKMKNGFRLVRKKVADINSRVENSIQGIREVKSYTNEDYEIEKFYEVNSSFRFAREKVFGILAGFHSGMMFLLQCYALLILGAGIILMYYGKANLSDIVTFFLYNRFITHPILNLVHFNEQLQEGAAAFERFIEVMKVEPEICDCEHPVKPQAIRGDIELKNVWFKYVPDEKADWILKNINLRIQSGMTAALVGESGAGKSTLAALIARFYEAQQGKTLLDGINVTVLEQQFLRANIGIVQQNVFLFDATIRENIMFGRPEATEEEMVDAAKKANIYDFITGLAEGFDSLVGEHGVLLSGGQKQRISIARAFLKNPPILVFDEATSSLDNESEALIKQSMRELCRNRTTVIIAHRLNTIRHADRIFVLSHGEIVETGNHKDLIAANGCYARLQASHAF